jgi:hypothetical protein
MLRSVVPVYRKYTLQEWDFQEETAPEDAK